MQYQSMTNITRRAAGLGAGATLASRGVLAKTPISYKPAPQVDLALVEADNHLTPATTLAAVSLAGGGVAGAIGGAVIAGVAGSGVVKGAKIGGALGGGAALLQLPRNLAWMENMQRKDAFIRNNPRNKKLYEILEALIIQNRSDSKESIQLAISPDSDVARFFNYAGQRFGYSVVFEATEKGQGSILPAKGSKTLAIGRTPNSALKDFTRGYLTIGLPIKRNIDMPSDIDAWKLGSDQEIAKLVANLHQCYSYPTDGFVNGRGNIKG
jgi:hypothetical protein